MLNQVRELVKHLGEIVNKAHLYDKFMETPDPSSARQTVQILVKYSRSMKDLLKKIQKLLPPCGTSRRMIDLGFPGSPTTTLYEVIGEVELVPTSQTIVGPIQAERASKQQEFGKIPDREKTLVPKRVRSPPIRRKSTRRGQDGFNLQCWKGLRR